MELSELWDDLQRRLIWQWGVCEGTRRFYALADGEARDLLAWRLLGGREG